MIKRFDEFPFILYIVFSFVALHHFATTGDFVNWDDKSISVIILTSRSNSHRKKHL